MSEKRRPAVGTIGWRDLTVSDAEALRAFYGQVVGWTFTDHDMGEYVDYNVHLPDSGEVVAGICHARGANADIPPQWLVYVNVADLDESMRRCRALGGRILSGPRDLGGYGRMCVLRDPAGAVAALVEPPA